MQNQIVVRLRANGYEFVGRVDGFDDSFFFRFTPGAFAASLVRRRFGADADVAVIFLYA